MSGSPIDLRLLVNFEAGVQVSLLVRQARVSVDLTDRKHGVNGVLGGVLATDEVVGLFKSVAGYINTQFCGDSPLLDGLLLQVEQSSDIMVDGTQDSEKECDGISIGLGFESLATRLGEKVTPTPPPDPCAQ